MENKHIHKLLLIAKELEKINIQLEERFNSMKANLVRRGRS